MVWSKTGPAGTAKKSGPAKTGPAGPAPTPMKEGIDNYGRNTNRPNKTQMLIRIISIALIFKTNPSKVVYQDLMDLVLRRGTNN